MIVWTPTVFECLIMLYACVFYFCISTCSAHLSMFHMEKRYRNTLIIIIIIILLPENLGTHCHEWPAEKAKAEVVQVQMLVETNSKRHDIMIYMDSSVTRDWSDWGFMVKQSEKTVQNTVVPTES